MLKIIQKCIHSDIFMFYFNVFFADKLYMFAKCYKIQKGKTKI